MIRPILFAALLIATPAAAQVVRNPPAGAPVYGPGQTAAAGFRPNRKTGNWQMLEGEGVASGVVALTSGSVRCFPFVPGTTYTISTIGIKQGSTADSGKNFQAAIYAASPTTLMPTGSQLSQTGSMSLTTGSATLSSALAANVQVIAGKIYWVCGNTDSSTATMVPVGSTTGFVAALIGSATQADVVVGGGSSLTGFSTPVAFNAGTPANSFGDLTSATWTDQPAGVPAFEILVASSP